MSLLPLCRRTALPVATPSRELLKVAPSTMSVEVSVRQLVVRLLCSWEASSAEAGRGGYR